MGASASKTASSVAGKVSTSATAASRKYPTRLPPSTSTTISANKYARQDDGQRRPEPRPMQDDVDETRNQEIFSSPSETPDLVLADRLRQLGAAIPDTTFPYNAQDPTISSAASFVPSVSNPAQTIFPRASAASSSVTTTTSNSSSTSANHTNTTHAQNSRENPAISLLAARSRLADEAETEFETVGTKGAAGRRFIDVTTVRKILMMRDETGLTSQAVESELGLRTGIVDRLGRPGVVGATGHWD